METDHRETLERIKELKQFLKFNTDLLEAEGQALREKEMPVLTEELFALYETEGNRLIYENEYFTRRKFLAVYGCLAILKHRQADLEKLSAVLTDICKEECWALPAHVDRAADADWRITVDLFASETAQALSEIIAMLGDELPRDVVRTVQDNVMRRILQPVMDSAVPYGTGKWEGSDHNWNAVCCGSIGSAALYLMGNDPGLRDALETLLSRLRKSLVHYIGGFTDDGACTEGLSYFTYGMTYYTGFAQQLFEYTEGKTDLMAGDKLALIAAFQQKCYFGSGRTLSFSDGDSHDRFKVGLTSYLAMHFSTVTVPNMQCAGDFNQDTCYRFMACLRDFLWTGKYVEQLEKGETGVNAAAGETRCEVLPYANWSLCKGPSGGGIAAKGGNNAESHNHNDVGSFLYMAGSDMLLTDLGCGEYTRAYFSETRYDILCNNSFSHNLPLINNAGQPEGMQYCSDWFEADGNGRTVISIAKAYAEGSIEKLIRTLDYDCASERLQVKDRFVLSGRTQRIQENLVTQFKPEMEENQIIIQGKEWGCRIQIEAGAGPVSCICETHSNHHGEEESVYRMVWDVLPEGYSHQAGEEVRAVFTINIIGGTAG